MPCHCLSWLADPGLVGITVISEGGRSRAFPDASPHHASCAAREAAGTCCLCLNQFLECFECLDLYHITGRLCLERYFFLGKRVDALARRYGWLAHNLDFHQSNDVENTRPFGEVALNQLPQRVEDRDHVFALKGR